MQCICSVQCSISRAHVRCTCLQKMYRRYIFRRPIPSNYNSTLSKYKGRCPRSGPLSSFQGSLSSPQVPGIHVDAVIASELDHDNLNIGLESDPTPPLRDGNCIPTQMRRVGIQDPGSRAIHGEREGGGERRFWDVTPPQRLMNSSSLKPTADFESRPRPLPRLSRTTLLSLSAPRLSG